jgi:hypothetical protein
MPACACKHTQVAGWLLSRLKSCSYMQARVEALSTTCPIVHSPYTAQLFADIAGAEVKGSALQGKHLCLPSTAAAHLPPPLLPTGSQRHCVNWQVGSSQHPAGGTQHQLAQARAHKQPGGTAHHHHHHHYTACGHSTACNILGVAWGTRPEVFVHVHTKALQHSTLHTGSFAQIFCAYQHCS